MNHDLIICTRNRPDDLDVALRSVTIQTRPPSSVIVVDASDDGASRTLVEGWAGAREHPFTVRYLKAEPGLPLQRNLGADSSTADIVHFIDDDVVLDPAYVASLAEVFEHDPQSRVVGAGGLISNQPPRHPQIWWRLALLDSKRSGVILRSGASIIVSDASARMQVHWLSGCSMSYRTEVVRRLRFDESLPGYALMEDVDFSFRAARVGDLVLEPKARLVHNVSPVGRWDAPARHRAATYRRGWFVAKNLPRWCLVPFWWSVVAGAIVQCGVALGRRQRWGLRIAGWRLRGGLDFVRGVR